MYSWRGPGPQWRPRVELGCCQQGVHKLEWRERGEMEMFPSVCCGEGRYLGGGRCAVGEGLGCGGGRDDLLVDCVPPGRVILMVGGKVPSTMSLEKATIFPYMTSGFVNKTRSRSTPQSNRTWLGGPATTVKRDGLSLRARKMRVLRQYFASGVV